MIGYFVSSSARRWWKSFDQAMRGSGSPGERTFTLTMPKSSAERLVAMVDDAGLDSEVEVIANALKLYEACLAEVNVGSKVIIRRSDGLEAVVME